MGVGTQRVPTPLMVIIILIIIRCASDIKMIDIWLVLCQMVPFVEVVLLTAMECQREDDTDQSMEVEIFDLEEEDETNVKGKARSSCIFSFVSECKALQLKTLGKKSVPKKIAFNIFCVCVCGGCSWRIKIQTLFTRSWGSEGP